MTTGKNKENFEKWLKEHYGLSSHELENYPLAFQWGVYLEYYDTLHLSLNTGRQPVEPSGEKWLHGAWVNGKYYERLSTEQWLETRADAQREALSMADTLANERL